MLLFVVDLVNAVGAKMSRTKHLFPSKPGCTSKLSPSFGPAHRNSVIAKHNMVDWLKRESPWVKLNFSEW